MPYLRIETNTVLDKDFCRDFLKEATEVVAGLLGKPVDYVMASLVPDVSMLFGGSGHPAAWVQLKSIGLPAERCAELSADLGRLVETKLGIKKDRVYIEFVDLEGKRFGWNGGTF